MTPPGRLPQRPMILTMRVLPRSHSSRLLIVRASRECGRRNALWRVVSDSWSERHGEPVPRVDRDHRNRQVDEVSLAEVGTRFVIESVAGRHRARSRSPPRSTPAPLVPEGQRTAYRANRHSKQPLLGLPSGACFACMKIDAVHATVYQGRTQLHKFE